MPNPIFSGFAFESLYSLRDANIARDKEWRGPEGGDVFPLSFRGCELAGEVGEACNIIKKMERESRGLVGARSDLPALADELADVMICVDLIAMDLDIDMAAAISLKFNKTSDKHGFRTRLIHKPELLFNQKVARMAPVESIMEKAMRAALVEVLENDESAERVLRLALPYLIQAATEIDNGEV